MMKIKLKAAGMLVGMIFGAGVFALPFVVIKAGIFWGTFHFLLALVLMIFLHLWYGDIAYYTEGRHRFTGYAEIILGRKSKLFAFLVTIFTDYGALLVYGLLGGIFLSNIFSISSFILSILVFLAGGFLIFAHFKKLAGLNFFLTVALLGLVVVLAFLAFPHIKAGNFILANLSSAAFANRFLPYGIWIFALAGFAAIPEVRDILASLPPRNFKKIIFISLLLCAVFYSLFIFTIVGVSGEMTTEDALTGAVKILGAPALIIGSLVGFLAIFTSFIALGADLKNIFRYDFKLPSALAWFCVVAPPLALFLLGAKDFIKILGIIGAIGLGLTGILIILMRRKLAEQRSESGKLRFTSWIVGGMIFAGIIAAVISEI